MFQKVHKREQTNEIMQKQQREYINIEENISFTTPAAYHKYFISLWKYHLHMFR